MQSFIKKIKLTNFFSNHYRIFSALKLLSILLLKIVTFNRGISKRIGDEKKVYKFDYNFIFSNYKDWGNKHNNGFNKLLELSREKKIVFDIGAHIGLCSLSLSRVINSNGMIYAFEPSEINLFYLKRNIQLNNIKNVKIIPSLVGSSNEKVIPFFESHRVSGMNSLVSYNNNGTYTKEYKNQVSLDEFCTKYNVQPDIIKIDVEGAEINVLKGGSKILSINKPTIILSVHPRHLMLLNKSVEELLTIIYNLGYNVYTIDGEEVNGNLEFKEYLLTASR